MPSTRTAAAAAAKVNRYIARRPDNSVKLSIVSLSAGPRTKAGPFKLDPSVTKTLKPVRFPTPRGKEIQGSLRHPKSQASRNWQHQESDRLKRALQSLTHGRDIFAYHNMRTNQVVYSLSRTLELETVHSQLIYHGKKTVPASLRKDMWIPYFSVHFSPSDRQRGLFAYQLLREFSMRRQLDPPAELITHTEESIAKRKPRDPNDFKDWEKEWKPRVGQFMQKRERARVLMDQKATAVADVAAVLDILNKKRGEKTVQEEKKLSIKARKRQRRARVQEELRKKEIAQKVKQLESEIAARAGVNVEIDVQPELTGQKLASNQVKILWNDIQDAQFARRWPGNSIHDELAPTKEHFITSVVKPVRDAETAGEEEDVFAPVPGEAWKSAEAEAVEMKQKKTALEKLKFWKG